MVFGRGFDSRRIHQKRSTLVVLFFFGGYAEETPHDLLVNRVRMYDERRLQARLQAPRHNTLTKSMPPATVAILFEAPSRCFSCNVKTHLVEQDAPLYFKNFFICCFKYLFNQNNFIGVKMPLTYLDFCNRTARDITT